MGFNLPFTPIDISVPKQLTPSPADKPQSSPQRVHSETRSIEAPALDADKALENRVGAASAPTSMQSRIPAEETKSVVKSLPAIPLSSSPVDQQSAISSSSTASAAPRDDTVVATSGESSKEVAA